MDFPFEGHHEDVEPLRDINWEAGPAMPYYVPIDFQELANSYDSKIESVTEETPISVLDNRVLDMVSWMLLAEHKLDSSKRPDQFLWMHTGKFPDQEYRREWPLKAVSYGGLDFEGQGILYVVIVMVATEGMNKTVKIYEQSQPGKNQEVGFKEVFDTIKARYEGMKTEMGIKSGVKLDAGENIWSLS